jgi:transcriptional regulator with XRE-family HTH domain
MKGEGGDTVTGDARAEFGRRVRELRQAQGLSQERLAEIAELHRTYVSSLERGQRNVSLENIHALARALGVAPRELFPEGGG